MVEYAAALLFVPGAKNTEINFLFIKLPRAPSRALVSLITAGSTARSKASVSQGRLTKLCQHNINKQEI